MERGHLHFSKLFMCPLLTLKKTVLFWFRLGQMKRSFLFFLFFSLWVWAREKMHSHDLKDKHTFGFQTFLTKLLRAKNRRQAKRKPNMAGGRGLCSIALSTEEGVMSSVDDTRVRSVYLCIWHSLVKVVVKPSVIRCLVSTVSPT